MSRTSIEWADRVWNPVTGCNKVSAGCQNCYAEAIAHRFWSKQYEPNPDGSPRKFSDVRIHPERLEEPLHWRKPSRVFVDSMSDLFHPDVPDEFIARVWGIMHSSQHTFLVLTKRPDRMSKFLSNCKNWEGWITHNGSPVERAYDGDGIIVGHSGVWPLPNVWLGVSVEDQATADERIPLLLQTPAAIHFVSCEPLMEPVDLKVAPLHQSPDMTYWMPNKDEPDDWKYHMHRWHGIQWVIAGGETGPNARPMHPDWARSLRDQCQQARVPFFFKAWGDWLPFEETGSQPLWQSQDGRLHDANCFMPDWSAVGTEKHWDDGLWTVDQGLSGAIFERVGKKAAGRLLDGVEWSQFPQRK